MAVCRQTGVRICDTCCCLAQRTVNKIAKDKKDAVVNKMQELAVAHHAHNPTGAKSGADYERIDDSDGSDNDWGDEDSD